MHYSIKNVDTIVPIIILVLQEVSQSPKTIDLQFKVFNRKRKVWFCEKICVMDWGQGRDGRLLCPQLWLRGSSPLATGRNKLNKTLLTPLNNNFDQVRLRLDGDNGLRLDPGTHGMKTPRSCTIVIIAGHTKYIFVQHSFLKYWSL